MTKKRIAYVSLLVRDYEEAKAWYCHVLGFDVVEDTPLSDGKRWILVAPPGSSESRLLLAQGFNRAAEQQNRRPDRRSRIPFPSDR